MKHPPPFAMLLCLFLLGCPTKVKTRVQGPGTPAKDSQGKSGSGQGDVEYELEDSTPIDPAEDRWKRLCEGQFTWEAWFSNKSSKEGKRGRRRVGKRFKGSCKVTSGGVSFKVKVWKSTIPTQAKSLGVEVHCGGVAHQRVYNLSELKK